MAELADAPDLGSGGRPCRFDSCYPYQKKAHCESNELFSTKSVLADGINPTFVG